MGRLFFVPANSSILSDVGVYQQPELVLSLYLHNVLDRPRSGQHNRCQCVHLKQMEQPLLPIPEVPGALQCAEAPPGPGALGGGLAMRRRIH